MSVTKDVPCSNKRVKTLTTESRELYNLNAQKMCLLYRSVLNAAVGLYITYHLIDGVQGESLA